MRLPRHFAAKSFFILLGLLYVLVAPALGLLDGLERDEATVAGGFPQEPQTWCLSRSLGLLCTTHFELKIAGRIFSHTDLVGGRKANSLSVLVENGEPVRVRYNRKTCLGYLCTILEADHKGETLVSYTPIGTHDAMLIWVSIICGGLCFWGAARL